MKLMRLLVSLNVAAACSLICLLATQTGSLAFSCKLRCMAVMLLNSHRGRCRFLVSCERALSAEIYLRYSINRLISITPDCR